jgi:hypothetical protein
MVSDPETNYSCLQLVWASKANCDQRRGSKIFLSFFSLLFDETFSQVEPVVVLMANVIDW